MKDNVNEIATILSIINAYIPMLDLELLNEAAKAWQQKAQFNDTLAVLNPNYNPKKTELLRVQAESMKHLAGYIESLREVTRLKEELKQHQEILDELKEYFE